MRILPLAGLVLLAVAISCPGLPADQRVAAEQVLANYRQSLGVFDSISVEVEINTEWAPLRKGQTGHRRESFIYRHDGNRYMWKGDSLSLNADGTVRRDQSQAFQQLFTDGRLFDVLTYVSNPLRFTRGDRCSVTAFKEDRLKELVDAPGLGGFIIGRIYGTNHKSVSDLLAESKDLKVSDVRETINGVDCVILQGTTPYGLVRLWVAPDRACIGLKWVIHKTGEDLFNDKPLGMPSWTAMFLASDIEQKGDKYIVSSGQWTLDMIYEDGSTPRSCDRFKLRNITLNPALASSGAFKLDVPDGTLVYLSDEPGEDYEWRGGKIVPRTLRNTPRASRMILESIYTMLGWVSPAMAAAAAAIIIGALGVGVFRVLHARRGK